jgi:predicted NUDIX family NTP pyrophosphohydrolase
MKNKKISAGLIMWDIVNGIPKILLAKPGGPYFWKKTKCFGIPKGQINMNEEIFDCAIREFTEETSIKPIGDFIKLNPVKYKSGKTVYAWIFRGTFNIEEFKSLPFEMEYPFKSGKFQEFPELIEPEMMDLDKAMKMILFSQESFIHQMRKYFISLNLL